MLRLELACKNIERCRKPVKKKIINKTHISPLIAVIANQKKLLNLPPLGGGEGSFAENVGIRGKGKYRETFTMYITCE